MSVFGMRAGVALDAPAFPRTIDTTAGKLTVAARTG